MSRRRSRWSGNLLWWTFLAIALFALIVYLKR